MSGSKTVIVVGAGIIGASVAYHLVRAGADVTLVDAGDVAAGVTRSSFAWIGASGLRTGPAAALRRAATDEYRRLAGELPGLPVTWCGSLSWSGADDAPAVGPGQEIVDAEAVARIEPAVRRPPTWAIWAPDDGAVDAVGVVERLVEGARAHGAEVLLRAPVTAIRCDAGGRVTGVETAAGRVEADAVVLAAGVETAALGAGLGVSIPVGPSPSALFRFRAPEGFVRTVVSTLDFDLRQVGHDRLIAAADSPERTLAAIRSTFRGAESVTLCSAEVGARPMPVDGEPIIGPVAEVPGLYVTVMHSAVTLAAAVGRAVAGELLDGVSEPLLSGCRLDRF